MSRERVKEREGERMSYFLKTKYDLNSPEVVSVIDELSLWSAPFGLRLLEMIKMKKNISALDIGFGLGFPLLEIAMRLGDSCKVYGIDPWEAAVERTKNKIEIYGINNVELFLGSAGNIPLPGKSIDLITSNNGINNIDEQDKVFRECARISRPGAQLLFNFNLEGTMIEFYCVLQDILSEYGMTLEIEKMKQHIYSKRKPVEEVIDLVEKNGFGIAQVKQDSFQFRYNDGSSMFNHFFIKLAFLQSWLDLLPGTKQEEIFKEAEKRLNRIAEEKGELRLTVPFVTIEAFRA